MSHGPEHHIEHAEHAVHAAHDAFNRNVTMSIAIVAAVLACVTMFGHRSHNDTLRLQGEALTLQTKASIKSTDAANAWAYYQSKNMFNLESEIAVDMLSVLAIPKDKLAEYDEIMKGYEGNIEHYSGDKNSRSRKGKKKSAAEGTKKEGKLAAAKARAEDLEKETKQLLHEADEKIELSHKEHLKAERLDYGELGLQLAVVLCSLSILTKNKYFWFGGIGSAVIGTIVASTGVFMGGHH